MNKGICSFCQWLALLAALRLLVDERVGRARGGRKRLVSDVSLRQAGYPRAAKQASPEPSESLIGRFPFESFTELLVISLSTLSSSDSELQVPARATHRDTPGATLALSDSDPEVQGFTTSFFSRRRLGA
jgi:hypothetical protein